MEEEEKKEGEGGEEGSGEIEFPNDATSGAIVAASADATAFPATADDIEWAVATIEEGEKRKLDNFGFGFGWDPETNFPKFFFNFQRTSTKKIIKWVKGKGRR